MFRMKIVLTFTNQSSRSDHGPWQTDETNGEKRSNEKTKATETTTTKINDFTACGFVCYCYFPFDYVVLFDYCVAVVPKNPKTTTTDGDVESEKT